jgi:Zn ribbon nucleic-acid-binding protein
LSTKLYDITDWCRRGDKVQDYPYIGEVELDVSIGTVIKVQNVYYSPGVVGKGYAGVHQIELTLEPDDEDYTSNVKCPYCGYENTDSWELEDSDENHECGRCGAIIAYERVVTVEYNASPKRPPDIVETRWA